MKELERGGGCYGYVSGVSEGGGGYGYISGVSAPQKRMVVNGGQKAN